MATNNPQLQDESRQFTLRELLIGTAAFGVLLGLAVHWQSAFPLFAAVAWFLLRVWRIRFSTAIVVTGSAVVGIQPLMDEASFYYQGNALFSSIAILYPIGLCALLLVVAFFVRGTQKQRRDRFSIIALAACCMVFPITVCLKRSPLFMQARNALIARQQADNAKKLQMLVMDVESLCQKLGDAPADEEEVVRLMGRAMPTVAGHGGSRHVFYHRLGNNHFQFEYFDSVGTFTYDNESPGNGWVRTSF